jgi:gliding motility-associated-like protein
VDCEADVYVPNTFSPNGDGINDVFRPFGKDFRVLELSVYDRWGRRHHRGAAPWDGGRAAPGVYVYRLSYLDLLTGKKVMRTGDVVLVW